MTEIHNLYLEFSKLSLNPAEQYETQTNEKALQRIIGSTAVSGECVCSTCYTTLMMQLHNDVLIIKKCQAFICLAVKA